MTLDRPDSKMAYFHSEIGLRWVFKDYFSRKSVLCRHENWFLGRRVTTCADTGDRTLKSRLRMLLLDWPQTPNASYPGACWVSPAYNISYSSMCRGSPATKPPRGRRRRPPRRESRRRRPRKRTNPARRMMTSSIDWKGQGGVIASQPIMKMMIEFFSLNYWTYVCQIIF